MTRWLLTVLLAIGGWTFSSHQARGACVVETTGSYAEGTNLRDDKCDTSGNKKVTLGGATAGFGTANAAAPTFAEAASGYFSWDLAGNLRMTLGTLLAGEDLVNNALAVEGAAVRGTVGNVASAVTTNTTSTAVALPTGIKTIYGSVDGTGAVTQTQTIYGGLTSGMTVTNGTWLGTIILSDTTHAHSQFTFSGPWLYFIVVTTNTTGTGATGVVTAMY